MDMIKEFIMGYIAGYVMQTAWIKLRSKGKKKLSTRCYPEREGARYDKREDNR